MKNLLCALLFMILIKPNAQSQSLAFEAQPVNREFTSYSPANFINYHHHRKHSQNYYVGGIVGLSGCVVLWSGILIYSVGSIQDYGATHPNYAWQHTGIGLMAVGGAMGIAGAIIGIKAKKEDKKRYGWQLMPKPNELVLVYNF